MEELIRYFTNLLILQYKNKPKAKATIEACVQEAFADTNGNIFPIVVQNSYDLDTAAGKQLDVIGKYIGYDRVLQIPIDQNFAYSEYDDSIIQTEGYSEYAQDVVSYPYKEYRYTSYDYYNVTDETYRKLLKMIAELKTKPLSLGCIDEAIYRQFGTDIYIVEGDKSINYHIGHNVYPVLDDQDKLNTFFNKYFPRPMGCVLTVIRD